MDFKSLTPKQKTVLDFVYSYIEKHGYSPSLGEIADHFDKAISTIHQYVDSLEKKGYLKKSDDVSRGITINPQEADVLLLGYIAAGDPIEPVENPESIKIPKFFIKNPGNYYALQVKGDSMIEEGILDGDVVIIRHQRNVNDGDIVVAITENGATLKKFRQKKDQVYLEPRNKKLKLIFPKELEIRGKFIGLIRKAN